MIKGIYVRSLAVLEYFYGLLELQTFGHMAAYGVFLIISTPYGSDSL